MRTNDQIADVTQKNLRARISELLRVSGASEMDGPCTYQFFCPGSGQYHSYTSLNEMADNTAALIEYVLLAFQDLSADQMVIWRSRPEVAFVQARRANKRLGFAGCDNHWRCYFRYAILPKDYFRTPELTKPAQVT